MKRFLCLLLCLWEGVLLVEGQNKEDFLHYRKEVKAEFEQFRKKRKTEFENFRKKRNEEFAAFLAASWKNYSTFPAREASQRREPVTPVVYDRRKPQPAPVELPLPEVIPPTPSIRNVPLTVIPLTSPPSGERLLQLRFYNTLCFVHDLPADDIRLDNTSEQAIGKCWKQLSAEKYETWINDCVRLREELDLCDWAYVRLVENVSSRLFPQSPDIQAIASTFLLVQSGYDARICRMGESLEMLVRPSHLLYHLSYSVIDGKNYYLTHPIKERQTIQTYSFNFSDKCIPVRMVMNRYPRFTAVEAERHTYSSHAWKRIPPFQVSVNPSVMRFCKDYPKCEWNLYGEAVLSPEFREQVLPVFRQLVAGKSQLEAAALLIDYVQYGFAYKTDNDQFGYEKPFFIDENFYYPFNDCEDRAILFARLIKELLHLNVAYLHYPGHLATAVLFTEPIEGDCIMINGQKYVVCDPTYIGAPLGKTMPQYKSVKARVVRYAVS